MAKKVIFLDIDGVIVTSRSKDLRATLPNPRPILFFDPLCVSFLRDIVEKTGAELVISSAWRLMDSWEEIIREAFGVTGWSNPPIIGRTRLPNFKTSTSPTRGEDIAVWLSENPVDSYVIIDDQNGMLSAQFENFVRTKADFGLGPLHADRCCEILGRELPVWTTRGFKVGGV